MLRPNHGSKDAQDHDADRPGAGTIPPPGGKRNAAATKQRILDAGEREFAARGFAGARLREIAESAGVQPALIHHYFTDKHGLYRAVVDRALLPSSTESRSVLESGLDLEGMLGGLVEVLLRFYAKHHNLLAILRHDSLSGSTVAEELARERTLPIVEAIGAILAEKQRLGEIRDDMAPSDIIGMGMGMVVFPFLEEGLVRVMLPSLLARDEAALLRRKQAIVALLLAGLRPDAAKPVKKAKRR